MKRKTLIKILLLAVLLLIPVVLIPQVHAPLLSVLGPAGIIFTDYGVVMGMVLIGIAVFLVFYPRLAIKHQLWGYGPLSGGDKIHTITACRQACLDYLHEFGYEDFSPTNNGHRMNIYGQLVNSGTSDTPCVMFLASTYPVSLRDKNKVSEIPEHEKHFVVVDRRNLECSYNPTSSSWEEGLEFFNTKKEMDVPLEMKKTLEKEMFENIKQGYARRLGESIAGGVNGGGQTAGEVNDEKNN